MSNPMRVLAVGVTDEGMFLSTTAGRLLIPACDLKTIGLEKTSTAPEKVKPRPYSKNGDARMAALDKLHRVAADALLSGISIYAACAKNGICYTAMMDHVEGEPGATALCNAIRDTVGYAKPGPKPKRAP